MSNNLSAAAAKDIFITPMLIHIAPADKKEPVITDLNNSVIPGLDISASSETIPGIGLTYMLSEKLAIETYLAFPPTHDILITGMPGIPGELKGGTTDMIPLAIFGQYHHAIPETNLTLVGGIGLIYAMFENIDVEESLIQLDPSIKFLADDTFGFSFQLGGEYKLGDKYHLRATYTKMLLDIDFTVATSPQLFGNLTSTLGLSPDLFMLGVAYKL